jgi:glycosyltransferase involved in cell wall biosynthesis
VNIKVCLLSSGLGRGGAEKQLTALASRLVEDGCDVQVVSMIPLDRASVDLAVSGIPVTSLGMARGIPDIRALARLTVALRQQRTQLLVAFNTPACLLGRVAGRAASVPAIVSSLRNQRIGGPCRERLLRWTDGLGSISCTNSEIVAKSLIERKVVRANRMRVIPNGLAPTRPPELTMIREVRAQLGVATDEFLWLAVGRLELQKDYTNLLGAAHRLKTLGLRFKLVIAGIGPLQRQLQGLTQTSGLSDAVTFLGLRDDIAALLSAADGFVMSSAWEGLPNAVMESLSSGTPVVATDVGGIRELVSDGSSGFISPARDPGRLSESMSRLMNCDQQAREQMGAVGRAHVLGHFSMSRALDLWQDLFAELLTLRDVRRRAA